MKEVNRARALEGYMDGNILIEEAATILERGLRTEYRMVAKVREKGPVHPGFVFFSIAP